MRDTCDSKYRLGFMDCKKTFCFSRWLLCGISVTGKGTAFTVRDDLSLFPRVNDLNYDSGWSFTSFKIPSHCLHWLFPQQLLCIRLWGDTQNVWSPDVPCYIASVTVLFLNLGFLCTLSKSQSLVLCHYHCWTKKLSLWIYDNKLKTSPTQESLLL